MSEPPAVASSGGDGGEISQRLREIANDKALLLVLRDEAFLSQRLPFDVVAVAGEHLGLDAAIGADREELGIDAEHVAGQVRVRVEVQRAEVGHISQSVTSDLLQDQRAGRF